ncbi:hypothetical protein [Brevibacillus laterosporus]|nr:hypothetical protein [Brevibacillus laterosporus]MDN9012820.1 hypothetical protein [Brevibacillus laterosporus]MDO0943911.1 hypothetical protein [Brevibacillus laterosporus]
MIHSFSRYGHDCPGGGYELRDPILLPHNQEWSIHMMSVTGQRASD